MQKNIVSAVNQALGTSTPKQKKEPLSDCVSTEELDGLKQEVNTLENQNQSLSETLAKLEDENKSLQFELEKLRGMLSSPGKTSKKKKTKKKTTGKSR